jgi:hypothetical protein
MAEDTGQETTQTAEESVASAVAEGTTETTTATTETTESTWAWSEGVAGEGDAPEWFKGDKYKSVADQAAAYKDLEGKFGAFTGAPENYEINVSEALQEKGVEFTADDPIMEEAFKMAKDMGMDQTGFDKLLDIYGMTRIAEGEALESHKVDEMKALGTNAEQRVGNLDAWGKANLPTDLYDGFVEMASSASSVKAMEQLISMTRNAPVNSSTTTAAASMSSEELTKMQFEKDDNGNRRLQTDPAFKARFDKLSAEVWGGHEQRIIVGGS